VDIAADLTEGEYQALRARKLESVAKAIFCEMNSVMHDHEECWENCGKQDIYRDCARAALLAAAAELVKE
jgi:hypothetical protein